MCWVNFLASGTELYAVGFPCDKNAVRFLEVSFVAERIFSHVLLRLDKLKASFANPILDVPTTEPSNIQRYPSYCRANIWPRTALPELEIGLKLLTLFVQNRIVEFHTELELPSPNAVENPCILGRTTVVIGGEHAFVKQLCRNSVIQSFTSFGGNLYGLKKYSTTLVRVEFNDQSAQFEEVIGGDLFDEPSSRPKWSGMYAIGYITENCGEILLVTKIYFAKRHWQVENIRVFRADLCARKWVEMESIGERTIFLGSVGGIFCINSNNANVRNNCIYFIEENDRNIYVFDLEDMSVSINLPCPHLVEDDWNFRQGSNLSFSFWPTVMANRSSSGVGKLWQWLQSQELVCEGPSVTMSSGQAS
nr:F-box/kelch-repeat protein At1g57790-like [Ipomoea batatas]